MTAYPTLVAVVSIVKKCHLFLFDIIFIRKIRNGFIYRNLFIIKILINTNRVNEIARESCVNVTLLKNINKLIYVSFCQNIKLKIRIRIIDFTETIKVKDPNKVSCHNKKKLILPTMNMLISGNFARECI